MNHDRLDEIVERARSLASRAVPGRFGALTRAAHIADGGSDRRFIRLAGGNESAVVLFQPIADREFDSYVSLARFLAQCGVAVPEIYAVDRASGIIIMEDLGDQHLETALASAPPSAVRSLYGGCLDLLVRLQTSVTDEMHREGVLADTLFDETKLLGETDYFIGEFVLGFCPVPIPSSFDAERRELARRLAAEPPVFMHRDFQSRNILVKNGRLRLVDFQTAHRGPGLYDAAALLRDSYHPLPPDAREELLETYYRTLEPYGALGHGSFGEFREVFTLAGIQRTMQALAAFAKLGLRRGKPGFLDSIPKGLGLLEEGLRESGRFPGISRMVTDIGTRVAKGS
jgi:aminoglycoside/choline kinase family phosphotransferase